MTDESEISKAARDAFKHGTGFMRDGKHVPLGDVYMTAKEAAADDLVKRLRYWGYFGYGHEASKTIHEAADCIEALEKERDEWKLRTMAAMHFVPDNVTFGEIRNIRAALEGEKKDG